MNVQHEEKHLEFIEKVIQLAIKNIEETNGGPFAAIIVKENQIIAWGANSVVPNLDPTAHAEILAIREACRILRTISLKGCVMYSSCEPCPMCFGACLWAGLDEVYYSLTMDDAERMGFKDARFYEKIRNPQKNKLILLRKVETPAAKLIIEKWNSKPDRNMY